MSEAMDLLITLALIAASIGVCLVILRRFPVTKSYRCSSCGAVVADGRCEHCA